MKKFFLLFLTVSGLMFASSTKADEGMWLPLLIDRLNGVDMQKMGCHLTPDEIYSINHASIKDAILIFGTGCTGELVSQEGLIFTNHHCGFPLIQAHSTTEQDLITNGFWAKSKAEELANEGFKVTFLVKMEDVSSRILKELNDKMTETERAAKVAEVSAKIEKEATEDNGYTASVKSFYDGNEFYLFVNEVYKDIRLVGAPPQSIGAFGGDTDNWMWPRHTGDFSIFRVYMSPKGKPAPYSPKNIPYKPKHFLPISINGVKENDFTMVLGYPGRTDRYLTSYGVNMAIEQTNPSIVKIREKKLALLKEDMNFDPETRIKYASKYEVSSNYWKFYIGQTKGLKKLDIAGRKKELEDEFQNWANADPNRKEKYGTVVANIASNYQTLRKYNLFKQYYGEVVIRGTDILSFAYKFNPLYDALRAPTVNKEKIDELIKGLKEQVKPHFKDFNLLTDKKVFATLYKMFYDDVSKDQHPDIYKEVETKYRGNFENFATDLYSTSIFSNELTLLSYLGNTDFLLKTLERDLAFRSMLSFLVRYKEINGYIVDINQKLNKENRLLMAGLMEMNPNKKFYPNANMTMRLTYGKVGKYLPSDAIYYEYVTTLDGIMQKEDPTNPEFIVPAKLRELYKKKDYGRYGDKNQMKVCFLTNNDITGGNSGSPVINGDGQLVGLAFDGNWEAMSGNMAFEPELQRCISVDIRYVLFIIDKFAGAKNIIDELSIVQGTSPAPKNGDKGANVNN